MWISNLRINAHWLAGVIMMLVATSPTQADVKTLANKERVMGSLRTGSILGTWRAACIRGGGDLPNLWAKDYFYMFEKRDLTVPSLRSVEIITQPKHGKVVLSKNSGGDEILQYIPNAGYVGQDRIEYRVNVEGHPVKLIYFVHVTKENLDTVDRLFCKANTWKISSSSGIGTGSLSDVLANATQSLTGFTDLSGAAVGTTTGQGKDATITLDTNAAGYGWFVDATPGDNSEFLPTSNPNEWVAKPARQHGRV